MGEKILIVDDDADTVKFISMILTRLGYDVVAALSGQHALELARSEQPDLIVLDVMMPGLDGYEVARILRQNPETATTPILMFTAKTQVDDKVTGYNAGVNIYLTKPIHPIDLQANIKTLLAQNQTRSTALSSHGYVVGVLAAKGGMGVSTFALNLAISYHNINQDNVIAAEMKPGQGSWAQELHLNSAGGLTSLLQKSASRLTQPVVSAALTPSVHGISLLLSSNDSKDVELVHATTQMEAVLKHLHLLASLVVLDIGTHFHPAFSLITENCDEFILVTEPQPNAVKHTQVLAHELRNYFKGTAKALNIVTLNRNQANFKLSQSDVEHIVGHSVSLDIPPATELAYNAAEQFMPMIISEPEGVTAQLFKQMAEQIRQRVPHS
jgi:CheY-like chemotaxis protein/MinD-like ATPase involved in chromosome partitioning or flagellar assembly